MEALQMAQMLADLNDLQAAQEQSAAKALVSANKNLDVKPPSSEPPAQSKPAGDSRAATPASRLDMLGRRMFTPPLSRTNSGVATSSVPGTPRQQESDVDIDRATHLLSLYAIRAKLKEQDNGSLAKAREKINALAAKQEQRTREQKMPPPQHKNTGAGSIPYPK